MDTARELGGDTGEESLCIAGCLDIQRLLVLPAAVCPRCIVWSGNAHKCCVNGRDDVWETSNGIELFTQATQLRLRSREGDELRQVHEHGIQECIGTPAGRGLGSAMLAGNIPLEASCPQVAEGNEDLLEDRNVPPGRHTGLEPGAQQLAKFLHSPSVQPVCLDAGQVGEGSFMDPGLGYPWVVLGMPLLLCCQVGEQEGHMQEILAWQRREGAPQVDGIPRLKGFIICGMVQYTPISSPLLLDHHPPCTKMLPWLTDTPPGSAPDLMQHLLLHIPSFCLDVHLLLLLHYDLSSLWPYVKEMVPPLTLALHW